MYVKYNLNPPKWLIEVTALSAVKTTRIWWMGVNVKPSIQIHNFKPDIILYNKI